MSSLRTTLRRAALLIPVLGALALSACMETMPGGGPALPGLDLLGGMSGALSGSLDGGLSLPGLGGDGFAF